MRSLVCLIALASYRHATAIQRRGAQADRLRHRVTALDRREERSRTVGFAIAIDDRVVAIEHLASPELFRDLREIIIASYLRSSVGKPKPREVEINLDHVRAFRESSGEGGPVPPRNRAAAPSAARPARP